RVLLTISQPYSNHNGGNIVFGPDGYLYIGMGDGGSANDPQNNGQNLSTLLGKMLRIKVDKSETGKAYSIPKDNPFVGTKGAAPEIWAYGLRNPWRFSFDPLTQLLYAGDVGQNDREEIDIIIKGKNYGWNIMEGTICTPGVNPNCKKQGLELPILDYPRSEGISVIGGYVYRGNLIPSLCGVYIYADYGMDESLDSDMMAGGLRIIKFYWKPVAASLPLERTNSANYTWWMALEKCLKSLLKPNLDPQSAVWRIILPSTR
ncbi:MAG: PQQ-dependent sugar dehydrogenase, partial [Nitrospira sp.]|nr:PQQ-dependent sugar dehydrogenase [Nitrospira sp.]